MLRKLRKYQNAETKTVVEKERYDNGGRDVNMFPKEPDDGPTTAAAKWLEDNDLTNAYIDERWKVDTPDDTWYTDEINHMTRSGWYIKPAALDQSESSNKEAKKSKEKDVEENLVLKQFKKIQVHISIWGLIMASREHRQALLEVMN